MINFISFSRKQTHIFKYESIFFQCYWVASCFWDEIPEDWISSLEWSRIIRQLVERVRRPVGRPCQSLRCSFTSAYRATAKPGTRINLFTSISKKIFAKSFQQKVIAISGPNIDMESIFPLCTGHRKALAETGSMTETCIWQDASENYHQINASKIGQRNCVTENWTKWQQKDKWKAKQVKAIILK